MKFVERDQAGKVKGLYANRQPGYAEEELADNHPEVIEFRTPKPPPPVKDIVDLINDLSPERKAVLKAKLAAL